MTIYLDYVFFINLLFDFILLSSLSILLKRNMKLRRIVIGSFFGGLSGFIILFTISSFFYFLLKIFLGILMLIIAFNYKDIRYTLENLFYLCILSIILGGFLYFINLEFGNTMKINIFILIILTIIFMYILLRRIKKDKVSFSTKYEVNIIYNDICYRLKGYLDTGNVLKDPYFNKAILIVNEGIFKEIDNIIYVPYDTISGSYIMECFKVDKVIVKGLGIFNNVLVGVSKEPIGITGIDIILSKYLLEEI